MYEQRIMISFLLVRMCWPLMADHMLAKEIYCPVQEPENRSIVG